MKKNLKKNKHQQSAQMFPNTYIFEMEVLRINHVYDSESIFLSEYLKDARNEKGKNIKLFKKNRTFYSNNFS